MKQIQFFVKILLVSNLFLFLAPTTYAQRNQYRMDLSVSVSAASGKLLVSCTNPITVFNRVDFVLSGTGASSATVVGGSSQTFTAVAGFDL